MSAKICVTALLLTSGMLSAASAGNAVPLWPNGAPGSEALRGIQEIVTPPAQSGGSTHVSGVHNPSLLVYLPAKEKATGAAMIVAPGGGHQYLSIDTEGTNVAEWLNRIGVAAFVLKYRLAKEPGSQYKVEIDPYADAQRAIRTLRARAHEWNIDASRIGFMGFSAGGEVAVMAATKFDNGNPAATDPIERQSSRPDFQILIYPAIQADKYPPTKDSPPAFILGAEDDRLTAVAMAEFYLALKKVGVPVEIHVYNSGGHGFGLRPSGARRGIIYSTWTQRLQEWMADVGMSPVKIR